MEKEMIVTELRCFDFRADCKSCHYHEAGAPYPYRLYWDAADLIEEQAAEIERLAAAYNAAQRALRLALETYSVDMRETERLERYYIKRAYGRQMHREATMDKKLELRPTKTHRVIMPTDKALEYLTTLKDYANAKLPDPGFAIALSMAIDCMSRAASEAAEPLTCNGCTYQADFPSHEKCHGCARAYTDHYRRPPEGEKNET